MKLLLHSFAVDPSYRPRQAETDAFLANLDVKDWLSANSWHVKHLPCHEKSIIYPQVFAKAWQECDELFNIEQDIVPTLDHLKQLENCKYKVCAVDYPIRLNFRYRSFTEQTDNGLRVIFIDPEKESCSYRFVREGTNPFKQDGVSWGQGPGAEWADLCSIGCTRFRLNELPRETYWQAGVYSELDNRLARWLCAKRIKAHMHYPQAKHHHYEVPLITGVAKFGDKTLEVRLLDELSKEEQDKYLKLIPAK
jgi:hypothetical protein